MNFDYKLISYNSKYHTHVTAHQLRDSKDTARHVTAHQLRDSRNRLEGGGGGLLGCLDAGISSHSGDSQGTAAKMEKFESRDRDNMKKSSSGSAELCYIHL